MGRHRAKVAVGTITDDGGPSFHTWDSWSAMSRWDAKVGGKHWDAGGEIKMMSGPRIVEARTDVFYEMLRSPALADATHLLIIDGDMGFPPDSIARMLDVMYAGTLEEKPIRALGGLCFAGNEHRMYPTIYKPDPRATHYAPQPVCKLDGSWVEDELGNVIETFKLVGTPYPRNQLVKTYATGAAFLMLDREVVMRLAADHPIGFGTHPTTGARNPYPFVAEGVGEGGRTYGEDIVLCQRIQAMGFGVYVDTRLKIDHWKVGALLNEATWHQRLRAAYLGDWMQYLDPQPVTEVRLP